MLHLSFGPQITTKFRAHTRKHKNMIKLAAFVLYSVRLIKTKQTDHFKMSKKLPTGLYFWFQVTGQTQESHTVLNFVHTMRAFYE